MNYNWAAKISDFIRPVFMQVVAWKLSKNKNSLSVEEMTE
jgi:hypothetical protein